MQLNWYQKKLIEYCSFLFNCNYLCVVGKIASNILSNQNNVTENNCNFSFKYEERSNLKVMYSSVHALENNKVSETNEICK